MDIVLCISIGILGITCKVASWGSQDKFCGLWQLYQQNEPSNDPFPQLVNWNFLWVNLLDYKWWREANLTFSVHGAICATDAPVEVLQANGRDVRWACPVEQLFFFHHLPFVMHLHPFLFSTTSWKDERRDMRKKGEEYIHYFISPNFNPENVYLHIWYFIIRVPSLSGWVTYCSCQHSEVGEMSTSVLVIGALHQRHPKPMMQPASTRLHMRVSEWWWWGWSTIPVVLTLSDVYDIAV